MIFRPPINNLYEAYGSRSAEMGATGHGAFVAPHPVALPNRSSHSGGTPSTSPIGLPRPVATPKKSAPVSVAAPVVTTPVSVAPILTQPITQITDTTVPLSPYQYNPVAIPSQPVQSQPVQSQPVQLLPLDSGSGVSGAGGFSTGSGAMNAGQTLSQNLGSQMPLSYSYGPAGPFGVPVIGASANVLSS